MAEDRYTRITLRIPKDIHEALAAAADATSKSMNAEIIARLQASIDMEANSADKGIISQALDSFRHVERSELFIRMKEIEKQMEELRSPAALIATLELALKKLGKKKE